MIGAPSIHGGLLTGTCSPGKKFGLILFSFVKIVLYSFEIWKSPFCTTLPYIFWAYTLSRTLEISDVFRFIFFQKPFVLDFLAVIECLRAIVFFLLFFFLGSLNNFQILSRQASFKGNDG